MNQQKPLSNKYNMTWGVVPAIISLLLGEIIHPDTALYVGVTAGVAASLYSGLCRGEHLPPFLLYATTTALGILGIFTSIFPAWSRMESFGLIQEVVILCPLLLLSLCRRRFIQMCRLRDSGQRIRLCTQGAEATLASAHILLSIAGLQLLVTLPVLLWESQPGDTLRILLYHLSPPLILLLAIALNQISLRYFNRLVGDHLFLPVVNANGDVIGKSLITDVARQKQSYLTPFIRIAVTHNGMLYLHPRPAQSLVEPGRTDLMKEGYLLFGETLEEGCRRLLRNLLPGQTSGKLHFCMMHRYEDERTNRLIYLFLAEADGEANALLPLFQDAKPWTLPQIEQNLGKEYFSSCFEHEYESLKEIIYTREKYKES